MALLSPYATVDEYRSRSGDRASGADAELTAQLLAMSRQCEDALHVAPGGFNQHTGTYVIDGAGGTVLRLRLGSRRLFLQSVNADGIGVDTERDGSYDGYALDFNDAWVRGLPANISDAAVPFYEIELLAHLTSAAPTRWPDWPAAVRVAGTFGWSAVPELVTDLVVHRTRELREHHKGEDELPGFDSPIPMRPKTAWLWKECERLVSQHAKLPVAF